MSTQRGNGKRKAERNTAQRKKRGEMQMGKRETELEVRGRNRDAAKGNFPTD